MTVDPVRILAIDGGYLARSRFEVGTLPGGFIGKLNDLRAVFQPRLVYVAWDGPGHLDGRREIWPRYKAHRKPAPEGYAEQVADLRAALPWFGVHQFEAPGYEADDVLATIARTYPGPVALYSRDKDLLQLVRDDVVFCRAGGGPADDVVITAATIRETTIKYQGVEICGLDAAGWLDLQTLAGDTCDGVPGVPGIGPRRALEVLDDLEQHRVSNPEVLSVLAGDGLGDPGKETQRVLNHLPELKRSRELVQLYTVKLTIQPAAPDTRRAWQWLEDHGLPWLATGVSVETATKKQD